MKYDLHSHTTASDGVLTPDELILRAKTRGIDVLAVTDHDTTAGLEAAQLSAGEHGVKLVNGIEFSVTWNKIPVHIVGLNIDPLNSALSEQVVMLQEKRLVRANKIALKLEKEGIENAFSGAQQYTSNSNITRTHFARYLIQIGKAKTMADVFKRYLSHGNPGYVSVQWQTLEQAVTIINNAGGQAVIAHPSRYKITNSKMKKLLSDFRELGGAGIEVVNSGTTAAIIKQYAKLAREFELKASTGSDFHSPDNKYVDLGRFSLLPDNVVPVWKDWQLD